MLQAQGCSSLRSAPIAASCWGAHIYFLWIRGKSNLWGKWCGQGVGQRREERPGWTSSVVSPSALVPNEALVQCFTLHPRSHQPFHQHLMLQPPAPRAAAWLQPCCSVRGLTPTTVCREERLQLRVITCVLIFFLKAWKSN